MRAVGTSWPCERRQRSATGTVTPTATAMSNGNGNGTHRHRRTGTPRWTKRSPALAEEFTRDVEVTRRLYRSGESEYLIDGEVCRLRDVHELLMDTGLGAKAYAIIEQGKIGMILSSRPTDRRQLIEEAAGITKYKSRRRSAELKLEAAQQNLTRIDDIVFEVEKQRGTLKRQAAKARRYRAAARRTAPLGKGAVRPSLSRAGRAIEGARARLADARERETAAAATLAEVEADLGRLRIELAEAESRASDVRERAHSLELTINRRQQQLEFNREQAGCAGRPGDRDRRRRSRRSKRAVNRRGLELEVASPGRTRGRSARDEAEAVRASRRRGARPGAAADRRTRGATSKRRARTCSETRTRRPRCGTRHSTPRPSTSASARRWPSSTSKRTSSVAKAPRRTRDRRDGR